MTTDISNDGNIPAGLESCYERAASQEEIYLEETEEEVRAILIFDNPCPTGEDEETQDQAAEKLITGDADDPPLSEKTLVEMLDRPFQIETARGGC